MSPQIAYLLNLSIQCLQSNKLIEAERYLQQVLAADPKNPDALCFMSVISAYRSDYKKALSLINQSIEVFEANTVAHSNKGNILKELGYHAEALASYERSIAIDPRNAEAFSNKGNALQELERYEEALEAYDKALALEPQYAEAYSNKGNALQDLGRFDDAMYCYQKSISINPSSASTWNNVAVAHRRLKNYQQALACQEKALEISPDYPNAWSNRGSTAYALLDYVAAINFFDKAISLKPDYAEAYADKGNVHERLGQHEEALACFQKAHALKSNLEYLPGFIVNTKLKMGLWDDIETDIDRVFQGIETNKKSVVPFPILAISNSPSLNLQVAKSFVATQHSPKAALPPPELKNHEKIRIGYFSSDFREHPVSLLTTELFEIHDRTKFEIYAFSLRKAPTNDCLEPRLRKAFDHFLDLDGKTDIQVAKIAREFQIDIAVDLGGHTELGPTGIFSYRAAPIQVGYLGFAGTVGANYMDYIIADRILIPESCRQYYAEKVAYLPDTYMVDDSRRTLSSENLNRNHYDLPEDKFVFCCFNNSYKFNRKILESWARILLKTPESVFWVSENNHHFKDNFLKEFIKLGVSKDRIIFAKRVQSMGEHLARYALADLFLDTNPYNAHTTAVDSLKAGLPILTFLGETFPGRVASSLLRAIGIPELIAQNIVEYEQLAIDFASNQNRLQAVKEKLVKNLLDAPLFNTKLYVKNIESLYSSMYDRCSKGLSPDHLSA